MKKCELENNRENIFSVSKKVAEHQAKKHVSQESPAPEPVPYIRTTVLPGETASPQTHATILNRAKAGGASQTNQVLRQLQRQYGNHYVQRVVDLARKDEEELEVAPEMEQAIQSKRGSGQDLDKGVRVQMESAFGADFSGVRVHTDAESDALNRSLNSRAFTTGQDIFFKEDEHNPGSSGGRELLAHELTHVVQQTGDEVRRKLTIGQPDDRYEQEADQVARAVIQQEAQPIQKNADDKLVQRQVDEEEELPPLVPIYHWKPPTRDTVYTWINSQIRNWHEGAFQGLGKFKEEMKETSSVGFWFGLAGNMIWALGAGTQIPVITGITGVALGALGGGVDILEGREESEKIEKTYDAYVTKFNDALKDLQSEAKMHADNVVEQRKFKVAVSKGSDDA